MEEFTCVETLGSVCFYTNSSGLISQTHGISQMPLEKCLYCQKPGEHFVPNLGGKLCREHFLRYFNKRVKRVLKRMGRGKKVLVGVSGGKDSIAALFALKEFSYEYNIELGALMIDVGVPSNEECVQVFEEAIRRTGARRHFVSLVNDLGITVPDDPSFACVVCGTVTRYVLNRVAYEAGYDYVATGHNLDDMAYFAINNLMTHNLEYLRSIDSVTPPVPELKMVGRVRPLFWLSDQDSETYVRIIGAPRCSTKCPHEGLDKQAYVKPLLNELRAMWPTSLVNIVDSVRELARRSGLAGPIREGFRACSKCGYPSRTEVCSFCRLIEKLGGRVPERLA